MQSYFGQLVASKIKETLPTTSGSGSLLFKYNLFGDAMCGLSEPESLSPSVEDHTQPILSDDQKILAVTSQGRSCPV